MSQLTEFAPLSPEESHPGVGFLLSKIFKFNRGDSTADLSALASDGNKDPILNSGSVDNLTEHMDSVSRFPVDVNEGRSLPNVLKRISNILALKSSGLQAYKDSNFKQYWMPDSVSKECYDCGEKFTFTRRKHHCRVCGQIFCSRCCNQEIPGKIIGCTGDLRVCTYCCKVVLSYLQSADAGADLTADLRAVQEDLQVKFGNPVSPMVQCGPSSIVNDSQDCASSGRKSSVGYQEDHFALGRGPDNEFLSSEERCRALQMSVSLRALHMDMSDPKGGITLQTHRYRLRTYQNCFLGAELVEWLMTQHHASTRIQAAAIGQALLEAEYIEATVDQFFTDGYTPYRLAPPKSPIRRNMSSSSDIEESRRSSQDTQEPLWVKQIPQDSSTTSQESESDGPVLDHDDICSIPSTGSTFYLDLNLDSNTVYIARPRRDGQSQGNTVTVPADESNSVSPLNISPVHCCSPVFDNSNTGISSEFLSGSFLVRDKEGEPPDGWHNITQFRKDNGEQQVYNDLSNGFKQHKTSLLKQLLNAEGLSQNWSDILVPLSLQVIDVVRPKVRTDTDINDIRKYVKFKKVSGGSKSESCIVNGVVCTKNVAHRSMRSEMTNPRILLIGCSIVYERVEGRLMSLEPVMMQESEYLRHVVARIADLQPDIVLVHRSVSRLAQEFLLAQNITLVLNVKNSVLERVARCTQADIVSSVDAHIGRPQLGICQKFYLRTFSADKGIAKTLMFFEGCVSPHLGCTVLLRGASNSELSKLKRVADQLIFIDYNWRLEKSFLMDEFARPPTPPVDIFLEDSVPSESNSPVNNIEEKNLPVVDVKEHNSQSNLLNVNKSENVSSNMTKTLTQSRDVKEDVTCDKTVSNAIPNIICSCTKDFSFNCDCDNLHNIDVKSCACKSVRSQPSCKEKTVSEDKRILTESVSDFSDPLHSYMNSDDDVFIVTQEQAGQPLSVAQLPFLNLFRKSLDDTILSSSPFIKFGVPYLETESGRNCILRSFFPKEIYWSRQFDNNSAASFKLASSTDTQQTEKDTKQKNVKLLPKHEFIKARLTSPADSKEVQTMLAHFRACGGRLPIPEPVEEVFIKPPVTEEDIPLDSDNRIWLDALEFSSHQQLDVLFYTYSQESNNTPAFCVNPWIFCMKFYGLNDIPLGGFLERYCFRTTYVCQSKSCDTPMMHHIQRFVHDSGCVQIVLKELDSSLLSSNDTKNILMWSWCSKCKSGTPVVPMSNDTWSLSFAKYLELRFHGYMYRRRGRADNICSHSLHHDHYQYFGYRNIVASFKYSNIMMWEVSLPPPIITFNFDCQQQCNIIEELKQLALKGYEVYSYILDKLCALESEVEGVSQMKQQLQKEQAQFKLCIEEVQLKLTSPTLECKKLQGKDAEKDVQDLMWNIEDSLVNIKRLMTDEINSWNNRIQDAMAQAKKKEEKVRRGEGLKQPVGGSNQSLEGEQILRQTSDDNASSCSEGRESPASPRDVVAPEHDDYLTDMEECRNDGATRYSDCLDVEDGSSSAPYCPSSPHVQVKSDVMPNIDDCQAQISADKKTVKTILSHLLPSGSGPSVLQSPLSPQEHYLAASASAVPIVVYETEPSSIIAYALSSQEYRQSLDEAIAKKHLSQEQQSASANCAGGNLGNVDGVQYSTSVPVVESQQPQNSEPDDAKGNKIPSSLHVKVQFSDSSSKFFCLVYYAEQFEILRQMVLPSGEESFIRSLSRCVEWNARGGKSGSAFSKTKDDRFILKELSKQEMKLFPDFAPNYFSYVSQCHATNQPTLLGKIVGVFGVVYSNQTTNTNFRSNLLVMENLFYGRSVTHKFDLKGSVRNRMVNPTGQEGEIVLLDENLLKMTCDSPLYIMPHSKVVLTQAIGDDTQFLASQSVMDYSLLVGLDQEKHELVVGIIDYIRTFTWDKKIETMVKSSGILGGQGKQPTIVSPKVYRERFIAAMHKYFLPVPNHWRGLGKGFNCGTTIL